MSGILGIWNQDGKPIEQALLARLSATLAHRGPDGEGLWIKGAAGLACRLFRITPEAATEVQPLVHSSGSVLVFDGRLDNREELLQSLQQSPGLSPASPDPVLVLAAYESFGDRFPEHLVGDFAFGLLDPRRQQLLLARDAIGIRPLYYAHIGRTFIFASEIKAILAHPQVSPRPNNETLADHLFNSARNTRGMTCFQNVFSLLPGHIAILNPQRLYVQRYWDFTPSRQIHVRSFQECAEAFRAHFERAVRRRLRSSYPVAVSVSGGLDSSSILCLAAMLRQRGLEDHPTVLGLSYTSPDGSPSDEKAYLLEIERCYGIAIEQAPIVSPGFVDGSREAIWHTEAPMLDEQWHTTHTFLQTAQKSGARVLLTGHWGDQVLSDQAYLIDLFHNLVWNKMWAHLKEYPRWFIDTRPQLLWKRLLRELVKYHLPNWLFHALQMLRAYNRERRWYTSWFWRTAHLDAHQQRALPGPLTTASAQSLYEAVRSSYHVQCMEWNNKVASMHGLEMAFPFLDRDLLSFLMEIPGEMRAWQGVPKALLRESMRGVLPDAVIGRTWKADFTHRVNEGMQRDYQKLIEYLERGTAVKLGYVDGKFIRTELPRFKNRLRGPTCQLAWTLSNLLALELWLDVFLEEETSRFERNEPHELALQMMATGGAP